MGNIFDKYYKLYDAWYDNNKLAYFSEIETIKKVLPKKGRGLEIGVGTGRFASSLGVEYGVDPSLNMLKIAGERGVKVKSGIGEHLPFEDSVFDYVIVIIALCFAQKPLMVLKEAGRVLNNNGKVIIGIIDRDSFLGRFYQRKKSIFYEKANLFSIKEVTNLLKTAGFNKFSYYQTIFQLPDKMTATRG